MPSAAEGAEQAGRSVNALALALKPLVATGPNEETLARRIDDVRARVAFYASTPAYRPCFEIWGLGDTCRELSKLSREQKWGEMSALVDDEMLNTFALVGDYSSIARKIVERYSGILDQVGFSIEVNSDNDAAMLEKMVKEIQSG